MNELEYRKQLQKKRNSELSSEEKNWLSTHPYYSEKFGIPFLKSDSIIIEPNTQYMITIKFEKSNTSLNITPTIAVPQKRGYIKSNSALYTIDHTPVPENKTTYVLSTCNDSEHPESTILYYSELGCIEIYYHCMIRDYRGTEYWGSSKMVPILAMKKETISASKFRFYCNDSKSDKFNSYVFTVDLNIK